MPDLRTLPRLDRVVATVNDAVILESEIMTLTMGQIRVMEKERGRRLEPAEREVLFRRNLVVKINQHALAQAAKTLGILPPERVEMIFQEELRQEEREQVRELGTYQKLNEERARQGLNWPTYEREQRVSKLSKLTQEMAVSLRLQNQTNLFITPRMMRDFYRANRAEFVHGSRAILGCIAFRGADAVANAKAAAELWAAEEITPEELERRFGDRGAFAAEVLPIDDNTRKTRRVDQVEFALAGPAGRVREPIVETDSAGDTRVRLWKILDHVSERSDPFDDPTVQRIIRRHMEDQVQDQLLDQLIRRSRERTQVWNPPDLR